MSTTGTAIDAAITQLVQAAPVLDDRVVAELHAGLAAIAEPPSAVLLARAIAAIVVHLAAHRVDPGIALPALAMACATLTDPRSTVREHDAARYEIDTLTPMPAAPDVTVDQLRRRS